MKERKAMTHEFYSTGDSGISVHMIPIGMAKENVGARLRLLRLAMGYENASEFGRRVGWTPSQLKNYEAGDQYPRMDQLEKLHRETLVGLDFILRGDLSSTNDALATRIRRRAELEEQQRKSG